MRPSNQLLTSLASTSMILALACAEGDFDPETDVGAESAPLADGLFLHWTFEDRDHHFIKDMSGNGNHGHLAGDVDFVPSAWGEAAVLDGADEWIDLDSMRDPADFSSGAFTISTRVKIKNPNRYNFLCVGCAPISYLTLGTSQYGPRAMAKVWAGVQSHNYPWSAADLPTAEWTEVTMVFEEGVGTRYYIGCEDAGVVTDPLVELRDYGHTWIGKQVFANSGFEGEIDDLKIWNRALAPSEIPGVCEETTPGGLDEDAPCSDAQLAAQYDVALPDPPLDKLPSIPTFATPVWTTQMLVDAVANGDQDIVLRPGTYQAPTPGTTWWLTLTGNRLWVEYPGTVVFEFGVDMGSNDSSRINELHGVSFDIDDPKYASTPNGNDAVGAAITGWGKIQDLVIEDVTIQGNEVLRMGIYSSANSGLRILRTTIDSVRSSAIRTELGPGPITTPAEIGQVRVTNVRDPGACSQRGYDSSTESGIQSAMPAYIHDVRIRGVRKVGINLAGESCGTLLEGIDIDQVGDGDFYYPDAEGENCAGGGVGVYFERLTENTHLRKFCIGRDVVRGVNSEWDHNSPNAQGPYGHRGKHNAVYEGTIRSWLVGTWFDRGTLDSTVHHVEFQNYDWAGIGMYHNVATELSYEPSLPNIPDAYLTNKGGTQFDNTFAVNDVAGDVCGFTRSYIKNAPVCEPL